MSMRRLSPLCLPALLMVMACSPEPDRAVADDLTATLPADAEKTETAAMAQKMAQDRTDFIARCRGGTMPSLVGTQGNAEDCNAAYDRAVHSRRAAMLLSDAFGANGAAKAVSLDDIRARLARVDWTEEQTGGSTLASGKLGDLNASINQRNQRQYLSLGWSGPAGDVPYDLADGMLLSGGKMDLIACYSSTPDETRRMWRVTPQHGDAFDLEVFTRIGPSGTAMSSHYASAALDGNRTTLETLRADDSDWNVCG